MFSFYFRRLIMQRYVARDRSRQTYMLVALGTVIFVLLVLYSLKRTATRGAALQGDFYHGKFPKDFIWSTATSSYQIEGGWNADGKGPSIWDTFSHAGKVLKKETGDIACDSYNKFNEDVALLKELGVSHYRFSISWPRILPDGTTKTINEKGISYYTKLIDALLAEGIQPMVTLYHWDLPQALEDKGGWLDRSIIDHFNEYAKLCFLRFGSKVKFWITHNEPRVVALVGYESGSFAPGKVGAGDLCYTVSHHLLLSHAKAWHTYNNEFRPKQKGTIGITLNVAWQEPNFPKDTYATDAAERSLQFDFGWYANPVIYGDYPEVMKSRIGKRSQKRNLPKSRLPEFTTEEKKLLAGSTDFIGLNFYTSVLANAAWTDEGVVPSFYNDKGVINTVDPAWESSAAKWLKVTPFGLRKILKWIDVTYKSPMIYVTENGVADDTGTLKDDHRIRYYRGYINEMLKAINLDGVKVKGYTAWSLLDNFEWASGYSQKFGLHHVDFNDPARPRTPKASAKWYKQLIKDNGF